MRELSELRVSDIRTELKNATRDETSAIALLEKQRWGSEASCPRCASTNVYQITRHDGRRNKDFRWRCRGCNRMFTVRTGTVFEQSKLPLRVFLYALWRGGSKKGGITALELAQEMDISFQGARSAICRIRLGLRRTR